MIGSLPGLSLALCASVLGQAEPVRLQVDASQSLGALDHFWAGVGDDTLYHDTHDPAGRESLRLARDAGIEFVRFHNLFTDGKAWVQTGCHVYSEDAEGRPQYNWTELDECFDFLAGLGFRLIVETDFMPDALADIERAKKHNQEGKVYRNYGGGWTTPPKDYRKWRDLIYETVRHCEERYGRETVRSWWWEVWNEPDIWWTYWIEGPKTGKYRTADLAEFCKLYDYFADGALAADPEIKIGGPGAAGFMDFVAGFVEHCLDGTNAVTGQRGTRLDFVSFHHYGVPDSFYNPGQTCKMTSLDWAFRNFGGKTATLKQFGLQLNEWGPTSTTGAEDDANETSWLAAYLCKWVDFLLWLRDNDALRVDQAVYWGVCNYWGKPKRSGLTVKRGEHVFRRPLLNAFEALSHLGPQRLAVTGASYKDPVNAIAARDAEGGVQIVVYHVDENDRACAGPPREVRLDSSGLQCRRATLEHFRIDAQHSNGYAAWLAAGSPQQPTEAQAEAIRAREGLERLEEPRSMAVGDGHLEITLSLPAGSVSLLVLRPM